MYSCLLDWQVLTARAHCDISMFPRSELYHINNIHVLRIWMYMRYVLI